MARRNELGEIRRSQVLMTWGPGSIVDFRGSQGGSGALSAMPGGLEEWDHHAKPAGLANPQQISEPRLQARLKVQGFRLPPAQVEQVSGEKVGGTLAAVRFPRWLQCPRCSLLRPVDRWDPPTKPGDNTICCTKCSTSLRESVAVIPVRFVVACTSGHIDDFPWIWWVHGSQRCESPDLELKNDGRAGLAGLQVRCRGCNKSRSLAGVFDQSALEGLSCRGRRPWLGTPDEKCDTNQRVLQRGASNIWFPLLASALDIPPWSDSLQEALGIHWDLLSSGDEAFRRQLLELRQLPKKLKRSTEELLRAIDQRIKSLANADAGGLREEEYGSFLETLPTETEERNEFQIKHTEVPPEVRRWVGRVVRATRLREVRVLRAFTRIVPPLPQEDPGRQKLAPLSARPLEWLPAIEVRGEGIFLELDRERLSRWETEGVRQRARRCNEAMLRATATRYGADFVPENQVLPRTLLLHSLSHALMRQLALSCGYPGASLRERLYASGGERGMCGLLIYTATPDAEGTLGGLVRMGEPDRLGPVLVDALEAMRWCSSDPLCIQGAHTQSEPQNGAACHACMLAAETSCELFNLQLDRALLVGTPEAPELGFFHELWAR